MQLLRIAQNELKHLFGITDGPSLICDRCVRMASELIAEEDLDLRSSP